MDRFTSFLKKYEQKNKNSLKKARLKRKIWTFLLFPKEMITLIMGIYL
ncbi:hypothetical protein CGSSp9BS68_07912 [Streptococcus pneumoniae SP9-BS68]|nr:hypothetical protein CGSSp9BS68_07912 [Streptococcus pneumoniae SP9-BS68]